MTDRAVIRTGDVPGRTEGPIRRIHGGGSPTPRVGVLEVPSWVMDQAARTGFDVEAEATALGHRYGYVRVEVKIVDEDPPDVDLTD